MEKGTGILGQFRAFLTRNRLGELLVMKGLISSNDLRNALRLQKETQLPLGTIFLTHNMISRRQLNAVLVRQYAVRGLAAVLFFTLTVSHTRARADNMDDGRPQIVSSAAASTSYKQLVSRPGLFGTEEKASSNLKPFTKWTSMFSRFQRQMSSGDSNPVIREWHENLAEMQGLSLKAMASRVNDLANRERYILDNKNWGQSDYWATPVEFMQRGGDCEDYAIAKYAALRALGVPEERLRVAIVHDNEKNIPHAVLAVYTDEGIFILDNQVKSLVSANAPGRYRPIFSINSQGWWLHTSPDATMMASAR